MEQERLLILELRARGGSYPQIRQLLATVGIQVSDASLSKFCCKHRAEIDRLQIEMEGEGASPPPPQTAAKQKLLSPATEISVREGWTERDFLLNLIASLSARLRLDLSAKEFEKDKLLREITAITGVRMEEGGGFTGILPRLVDVYSGLACLEFAQWSLVHDATFFLKFEFALD